MNGASEFLIQHGEALLFAVVFAEQIGLPIPGFPFLIGAGALAGAGKLSLPVSIAVVLIGSLAGDLLWFYLGRHRGSRVLNLLCRISLEPDSCIRRTEGIFSRHGAHTLLWAKFVPGLSTVAPPLAGIFGMGLGRFTLYSTLGALIWAGVGLGLGVLFSSQLEQLGEAAGRLGATVGLVLATAFMAYLVYKMTHRFFFLRRLRPARISVDELRQKMEAGERPVVVDLRHAIDIDTFPHVIPGAVHMLLEEIEHRHHEIPRDREIILYCSCPNEASAAQAALKLKRKGIESVRPLAGGIAAWHERNFPMEQRGSAAKPPVSPSALAPGA